MRIGLFGYGKMGKAVEALALARNHQVSVLRTQNPISTPLSEAIDCIVDFSDASVAPQAIRTFLDQRIPVISGTTGLADQLDQLRAYCTEVGGAFCHSPNFSPGMHITFHLNAQLARIMSRFPEYIPSILEVHHTGKRDAPSGTALALADQVIKAIDRLDSWSFNPDSVNELLIESQREGDVKGIHRISYQGPYDTISLRHHALSRDGFALGAVMSAEWISGRTGCYSFQDVLGLAPK